MTPVARCWTCDLDFTSADAWKLHDQWHQDRGEAECLLCGELLPRRSVAFHPCSVALFASPARLAAGGSPAQTSRRRLRLVEPEPSAPSQEAQ